MTLSNLINLTGEQKIAVIGLGKENLQFLEWLLHTVNLDATRIVLADRRQLTELGITQIGNLGIEVFAGHWGQTYLQKIAADPDVEYVFKAPGIWSLEPELEKFRNQKGENRVLSSLSFFVQKFRGQIIGVTGTKGKSTTSSLIQHMFNCLDQRPTGYTIARSPSTSEAAVNAVYCGNTTGISPYQYWTKIDQPLDPKQHFIIELSSFQLQDLGYSQLSPKYAVITNYYVDHLDQHADTQEYWAAKDNLFQFQTVGDLLLYTQSVADHSTQPDQLQHGLLVDEQMVLEISHSVHHKLLGVHNQTNLAEAALLVESIRSGQVDARISLQQNSSNYTRVMSSFRSLPHRLELIRIAYDKIFLESQEFKLTLNFYDDGAGSEPEAVLSALKALSSKPGESVWLFVAGVDKGPDLTNLAQLIVQKEMDHRLFRIDYCGVIGQRLLGEVYAQMGSRQSVPVENFRETVENSLQTVENIRIKLERWLQNTIYDWQEIGLKDKVRQILNQPEFTLNIVFSPGGSSFDEFDNYLERSEWWVKRVQNL